MSRIEKVNEYWQQQEATWQSMFKRLVPEDLPEKEGAEIIGYFPDLKGKKVLDLAAGIGRFTRYFSSVAHHIVSVDIASHFIEKNRLQHQDCPNASFLCSDAMDLHFKPHYFDFIFINWLFLYLEDVEVEVLLDRIHQWLSPSGMLFFRETCDPVRSNNSTNGYFAQYRTLSFYDAAVKEKFTILKEGSIQAYIDCFADPTQCYWLVKKKDPAEPSH